jgi:glycosyltransferase involved in cell wall biosynthesis
LIILHVTNCFNAGVLTAIENLIHENPQHEHFLLWSSHSDSPEPSKDQLLPFSQNALKWNGNLIEKFFQLRRRLREIQPDLIHYHSSIAGLLGRILNQRSKSWYSPHCFAFQRLDISKSKRMLFFLAERILSIRTGVYAAHWPVEIKLMRRLNPRIPISFIPIVKFRDFGPFVQPIHTNRIRIICVGRFRPQKDPDMFIGIAQRMKDSNLEFTWIGSLTEEDSSLLDSLGIKYFQWLDSEQLAQVYSETWLTLITSAWESGPLTFFESISHGTPVLARDIEALEWLSVPKFKSIDEACVQIKEMLANDAIRRDLLNREIQQTSKVFANYSQIYSSYPLSDSLFQGELEN